MYFAYAKIKSEFGPIRPLRVAQADKKGGECRAVLAKIDVLSPPRNLF